MGLETFTGWIKDLVSTNPAGTDPKSEGDDHLRGLKNTLKTQFSGMTQGKAITVTEDQLNDAGKYSGSLWRRNLLINGDMRINQRGVEIAAAPVGTYGPDRWKRTAGGMTQIIEGGEYEPSATYTLSGVNVTTVQVTAPASGHWTLPDIPITATKVQLERGTVATPFERLLIGETLALCQRYYETGQVVLEAYGVANQSLSAYAQFSVTKRSATPTIVPTDNGSF